MASIDKMRKKQREQGNDAVKGEEKGEEKGPVKPSKELTEALQILLGDAREGPPCPCRVCLDEREKDVPFLQKTAVGRMIVCPTCGNKRCPHAANHNLKCTGSNAPGQAHEGPPAAPGTIPAPSESGVDVTPKPRQKGQNDAGKAIPAPALTSPPPKLPDGFTWPDGTVLEKRRDGEPNLYRAWVEVPGCPTFDAYCRGSIKVERQLALLYLQHLEGKE